MVSDPNFVSSFVYSDNVYFFFREMAVENINCGKVGSACKFFVGTEFSVIIVTDSTAFTLLICVSPLHSCYVVLLLLNYQCVVSQLISVLG